MDTRAVLADVKTAGALNRFELSSHCQNERMPERGVRRADIRAALQSCTDAVHQPDQGGRGGTWLLTGGHDRDGDPLTVSVALVDGVLVVTVF